MHPDRKTFEPDDGSRKPHYSGNSAASCTQNIYCHELRISTRLLLLSLIKRHMLFKCLFITNQFFIQQNALYFVVILEGNVIYYINNML